VRVSMRHGSSTPVHQRVVQRIGVIEKPLGVAKPVLAASLIEGNVTGAVGKRHVDAGAVARPEIAA
jgi:hypothetical protein